MNDQGDPNLWRLSGAELRSIGVWEPSATEPGPNGGHEFERDRYTRDARCRVCLLRTTRKVYLTTDWAQSPCKGAS